MTRNPTPRPEDTPMVIPRRSLVAKYDRRGLSQGLVQPVMCLECPIVLRRTAVRLLSSLPRMRLPLPRPPLRSRAKFVCCSDSASLRRSSMPTTRGVGLLSPRVHQLEPAVVKPLREPAVQRRGRPVVRPSEPLERPPVQQVSRGDFESFAVQIVNAVRHESPYRRD